jgi:hypothetical protein
VKIVVTLALIVSSISACEKGKMNEETIKKT